MIYVYDVQKKYMQLGYTFLIISINWIYKNKEIGWLAALQLSSTFFSHVEAEMLKTLCF